MRKIGSRLHNRVTRSGSWYEVVPNDLAASGQVKDPPAYQRIDLGFRLVRKV